MPPTVQRQRCLYEVLEVQKEADEDAIKKAYRKQALLWHPGMWRAMRTLGHPGRWEVWGTHVPGYLCLRYLQAESALLHAAGQGRSFGCTHIMHRARYTCAVLGADVDNRRVRSEV